MKYLSLYVFENLCGLYLHVLTLSIPLPCSVLFYYHFAPITNKADKFHPLSACCRGVRGEREAGHRGTREVGNVAPDTEITFQFGANETDSNGENHKLIR